MQVVDLVKLAYQNEFAGGHLIVNEAGSLQRLDSEVRALQAQSSQQAGHATERFESIGNGLCRMNLAMPEPSGIDLATVNRFFVCTAGAVQGTQQGFRAKLDILRQYLEAQQKSDGLAELESFVTAYDFENCPPVSHSAIYRESYNPAYRIVLAAFRDYFAVFCRIDAFLKTNQPLNVAIDGYCGSGKSTLADLLQQIYDGNVIRMDHFFLPPDLRTAGRLLEPGGNIDYDRFMLEVSAGLQNHQAFEYGVFNCKIMRLDGNISIRPNRLNIIEGSYSMHPKFRDLYDLKVFMKIDKDEQIRRIQLRNSPDQLQQFVERWIPMENRYFSAFHIAEHCDLVISGIVDQQFQD